MMCSGGIVFMNGFLPSWDPIDPHPPGTLWIRAVAACLNASQFHLFCHLHRCPPAFLLCCPACEWQESHTRSRTDAAAASGLSGFHNFDPKRIPLLDQLSHSYISNRKWAPAPPSLSWIMVDLHWQRNVTALGRQFLPSIIRKPAFTVCAVTEESEKALSPLSSPWLTRFSLPCNTSGPFFLSICHPAGNLP